MIAVGADEAMFAICYYKRPLTTLAGGDQRHYLRSVLTIVISFAGLEEKEETELSASWGCHLMAIRR